MVARPVEARPPAAPLSFQKKVGGKKGQGGGFRVPPPCTHPLDRPRRGNCDSPFLEFPPSCSTGNSPAAKAYFVTPPPLGAGDHRSPLRIITTTTEFFGGKAPTAARRARPIQRTYFQGLRGNPDACHPRRGVVGPSYGSFASGQARKLIPSAGPPLPTEPASLGFGGGPNYRKRQPMGRAAMHARSLPCPYSAPPP